jgi:hypothetical protein
MQGKLSEVSGIALAINLILVLLPKGHSLVHELPLLVVAWTWLAKFLAAETRRVSLVTLGRRMSASLAVVCL